MIIIILIIKQKQKQNKTQWWFICKKLILPLPGRLRLRVKGWTKIFHANRNDTKQ